jgi:asparaginyl-tRNA synthetase
MSGSRVNQKNEKTAGILKIRAKLLDAARKWFKHNNYTEVHGPTIIPAVGDWPRSFEINYFGHKAYLAQGLQPYDTAFVANLGKVYTIAPAFRAEKLDTQRHLAEYWRIEVAQKGKLKTMIQSEEELITHICQSLSKEAAELLSSFGRSAKDLEKMKSPFPRLTYDEAVNTLQKHGFDIFWGQKISWQMEKHLSNKFKIPFFITKSPLSIETYFHETDPEAPELTLSADLIAPEGYGELSSGAQRITKKETLSKKMMEENINAEDQEWYLNFVQSEVSYYSGFAVGIERLTQWIAKLLDIKKATAFPRSYNDIYP